MLTSAFRKSCVSHKVVKLSVVL